MTGMIDRQQLVALTGLTEGDFAAMPAGEWHHEPHRNDPGSTFYLCGATGYLAMIACCIDSDDPLVPRIDAGRPRGRWPSPGTLNYTVGKPAVHIPSAESQAERRRLLVAAVNASAAAHRRSLRTCSHCHERIPPEHMLSDTCCYACGSKDFGIVY